MSELHIYAILSVRVRIGKFLVRCNLLNFSIGLKLSYLLIIVWIVFMIVVIFKMIVVKFFLLSFRYC